MSLRTPRLEIFPGRILENALMRLSQARNSGVRCLANEDRDCFPFQHKAELKRVPDQAQVDMCNLHPALWDRDD